MLGSTGAPEDEKTEAAGAKAKEDAPKAVVPPSKPTKKPFAFGPPHKPKPAPKKPTSPTKAHGRPKPGMKLKNKPKNRGNMQAPHAGKPRSVGGKKKPAQAGRKLLMEM